MSLTLYAPSQTRLGKDIHVYCNWTTQREGYPETRIFCDNVGYVLAQTICFIFCKHKARGKPSVQSMKQIACAKT